MMVCKVQAREGFRSHRFPALIVEHLFNIFVFQIGSEEKTSSLLFGETRVSCEESLHTVEQLLLAWILSFEDVLEGVERPVDVCGVGSLDLEVRKLPVKD